MEGFVVTPYLQWRTKSERVDVVAESPLQTDNGLIAFGVNKILTDFKKGWLCLHALAHFNHHQEHSDYLIVFDGGDYIEIGLVTDNTLFCVLDFYLSATFGRFIELQVFKNLLESETYTEIIVTNNEKDYYRIRLNKRTMRIVVTRLEAEEDKI